MSLNEIIKTFETYFKEQGYTYVKQHSLMPPDNTILFNNSGMCQFKKYFLGEAKADIKKVFNIQRCIRAGGKHNDFDDVGFDTYHHTMFHMMGFWDFDCDPNGSYKSDAIKHGLNLLVANYGLDPKRIYVTYFGGTDKIPADTDTRDIWLKYFSQERILPFTKENFWEMADVGPCGPCTEIHYDLIGNRDASKLVNKDDPTVIELWNTVFMQYNRKNSDTFDKLPLYHVDVGGGLERIVAVIQNKSSNYDTDIFQPLFQTISNATDTKYTEQLAVSYRIIADHLRTIIYAINDDIVPHAEGRGFILNKLFKRACHYAYTHLKLKKDAFANVCTHILNTLIKQDNDISGKRNVINYILHTEEIKHGKHAWSSAITFLEIIREI